MHNSQLWPQRRSLCQLRPATPADQRQVWGLNRRLHQAALPQRQWQEWLIWSLMGSMIALFWHYPSIGIALTVSGTPLWLIILFSIWITRQEQKRQYNNYWVMEYAGQIIGCGRIDIHRHHAEIYDLFVLAEWRSCGVGQAIMQKLIAQSPQPIYLASLPTALTFYQQLGFAPIKTASLPTPLATRLSLNSPRYRRVGLQAMVLHASSTRTNLGATDATSRDCRGRSNRGEFSADISPARHSRKTN